MNYRTAYMPVTAVLATFLAVANARHLSDASANWVIRYSSIMWGLMAVLYALKSIDAVGDRPTDT